MLFVDDVDDVGKDAWALYRLLREAVDKLGSRMGMAMYKTDEEHRLDCTVGGMQGLENDRSHRRARLFSFKISARVSPG